MPELIPAISQLGFPIAIAGYLLWDYSKKLVSMQLELVKISERQFEIIKRLESIEGILNERHK